LHVWLHTLVDETPVIFVIGIDTAADHTLLPAVAAVNAALVDNLHDLVDGHGFLWELFDAVFPLFAVFLGEIFTDL